VETPRGCLGLEALRGTFGKDWADCRSYLLCLLIYTTGMRNSEMEKLRMCDIIKMQDVHFINIKQSKTENGLRDVPLHPFVYDKIMNHAKNMENDDFILAGLLNKNKSAVYKKANADLGAEIGFNEADLAEKGITFYSGRHFWKTMMSAAGLGELTHGEAVAWGIARACDLGVSLGITPAGRAAKIVELIAECGYETAAAHPALHGNDDRRAAYYKAMLSDKKKSAAALRFVIPNETGAEIVRIDANDLPRL
jgi:hypothetical protein